MPRRNNQQKNPTIKRVTSMPASTCKSKRRFSTEKIAIRAADDQMLKNSDLNLTIYKCSSCQGWHLTRLIST